MSKLAVLALVAVCLLHTAHGSIHAFAVLNGKHQVPVIKTAAKGMVDLKLNATHGELSIQITYIKNFTMAHIHGPANNTNSAAPILGIFPFLSGPPLAMLNPPLSTVGKGNVKAEIVFSGADLMSWPSVNSTLNGTANATTAFAQFAQWLLDGLLYVNVHTVAYPNGEIRGQLK